MQTPIHTRTFPLETKPDAEAALARIDAWYHQEIIDRPPVRFSRHNAFVEASGHDAARWPSLRARWFDVEYQIERFQQSIAGKTFLAETFPVFWPNLGPNVFAALYGCPLEFGEVTSWAEPILHDDLTLPPLDWQSPCLATLDALTKAALEVAPGRFWVGYTDLHPGLDAAAALRGTTPLCLDLYDQPDAVLALLHRLTADFLRLYDHFATRLEAAGQPSVSWMDLPFWGRMHIPSCDFGALISPRQFRTFALPALRTETQAMTHNIFHLDGKRLARNLDAILELPNVGAIQWVQGVGDDQPIGQWFPFIHRLRAAGKSVIVDLEPAELEPLIDSFPDPRGLLLCLPSEDEAHERSLLARIARW